MKKMNIHIEDVLVSTDECGNRIVLGKNDFVKVVTRSHAGGICGLLSSIIYCRGTTNKLPSIIVDASKNYKSNIQSINLDEILSITKIDPRDIKEG